MASRPRSPATAHTLNGRRRSSRGFRAPRRVDPGFGLVGFDARAITSKPPGSPAPPTVLVTALARGFAVVTTDTGHTGEVFDATFMREQQASLDFAYQAVGRVAFLAKQIVALHYGHPVEHAYFAGCSTGGREGMLMAQRYPTYFDGIVVGAPAMRTSYSHIGDEWVATMLNQVAPQDASGRPD